MKLTIPNLLSLLRMGLVPLFIIAVLNGEAAKALLIFGFAGLTDALDGAIARLYDQHSLLGTYLDPIADKLLLTSAFVVLAIPGQHPGLTIPMWVTVLVIFRDLLIVLIALVLQLTVGVRRFPPHWTGKVNTVVQVVTALVVLSSGLWTVLELPAEVLVYLTALTTAISGLTYIFVINRLIGEARVP